MAKAKQLPSGNWRVVIAIGKDKDGKRIYKSFTGSDRRRVERIAADYADEHRRLYGKDSFGTAMDAYIDSVKAVLSPSTIRGYNAIANALKSEYRAFCELPVYDISQDVLQGLINQMTRSVSSKTIRNRLALISTVIKTNGYVPPYVKLPEKVKPSLRIPDVNDVRTLLKAAEGTDLEVPLLLAAFAPMRRGEICALRLSDIEGNVIHVQRAVVMDENCKIVEKAPKTYDSDRYIVMPDYIIQKIKEKGYITKFEKPNALTSAFERLAKKCGLEGVRMHDLRHFATSYFHAIGVPEAYLLERGGWSASGNVMRSVYRHTMASEQDRISQGILTSIESILGRDNSDTIKAKHE